LNQWVFNEDFEFEQWTEFDKIENFLCG